MKNIKVNDFVQLTHNCIVQSIVEIEDGRSTINVKNVDLGTEFSITGDKLIDEVLSANDVLKEERVSQNEVIDKLVESNGKILSANFDKKDGNNRTIYGIFFSLDMRRGYSNVIDLEKPRVIGNGYDNRLKKVNHNTLHWVIIEGVRWVTKK